MRDEHGVYDFVHFVCKYCNAPYENPIDFAKHKREKHPVEIRPRLARLLENTEDNTPGCSTSISSESSCSRNASQQLSKRLSQSSTSSSGSPAKPKGVSWKTGRYFYGCRLCMLKFKTYEEMATHKKSKHPHLVKLMGEFDCPYCDSKYNCKKNFGAHISKHRTAEQNGSHISCPQCTKKFLAQSAFDNHQLMFHSSGTSSKLEPKVLKSSNTKRKVSPLRLKVLKGPHANRSRPKVVLQLAPPPPLQTPTKPNGSAHTPQSGSEEEPTVNPPPKVNQAAQKLKTLQRRPGPPAQMIFGCFFCDKRFKSRDDRTEHEIRVHKIQKKVRLAEDEESSSTLNNDSSAPPMLTYDCTFCEDSFTAIETLLDHVKSTHATPSNTPKPNGSAAKERHENPSIWTSMRQSPNKIANHNEHSAITSRQLGTKSRLPLQKTISVAEVARKVNYAPEGHAAAKGSSLLNKNRRLPSTTGNRAQLKRKRASSRKAAVGTPKKCKDCDYRCQSDSGMLYHRMKVHPETRQHKCDQCRFSFIRESQLKLHLRIHNGETVHKCQFCDSRFTAHGILVRHMRKDHLTETLFSCQFCSIMYYTFNDWYEHIRASHTAEEIEGIPMED